MRDDVFHHRVVTIRTVGHQHLMAAVAHLDRLVKILESKRFGVQIAILCFDDPLVDRVVRDVTVVAVGDRVMRSFLPAIKLISHDVAVDAGGRIIRQV